MSFSSSAVLAPPLTNIFDAPSVAHAARVGCCAPPYPYGTATREAHPVRKLYRRKRDGKPGGPYICSYYDAAERKWRQKSTRCYDKKAAESRPSQIERDAADPDYAATNSATLNDALTLLLEQCREQVEAGNNSPATLAFYQDKAGVLVRVIGHHFFCAASPQKRSSNTSRRAVARRCPMGRSARKSERRSDKP
jgi:hypothetical protein